MIPTTTTAATYTNPAPQGLTITFLATVSPIPDGGTVTFTDTYNSVTTTLETISLYPNGTASYATDALLVGSHTITATYNGFAGYSSSTGQVVQVISAPAGATKYLPGYAAIAGYSTQGDSLLAPSAIALLVPISTSGVYIVPSTPVFIFWNLTNILQVRVTGDNGIDLPVDSGFINTVGLTSGSYEIGAGFTHDIVLTFEAYSSISPPVVITQLLPANYASGAMTGLTISPLNPVIAQAATQQFTAIATFADSSTAPLRAGAATWSSSDTTNATIDASSGLATGVTIGGGGSTIEATYSTFSASTHLVVYGSETRIPALVSNQGQGVLWENTSSATASGTGTSQGTSIYQFSIASGVATFVTTPQSFQAGQQVVLSSFANGLNGLTVTVLPTGLTSTSFEANVTLGDSAIAYCGGTATPTTAYALGRRFDMVDPGAGNYALYVPGGAAPVETTGTGGHKSFAGFLPVFLSASMSGNLGINGTPLGPNNVSTTGVSVSAPTLPVGAVVSAVYAYLQGTHAQVTGSGNNDYIVHWGAGNTHNFVTNGSPSTVLLGSDPSVISTAYFTSDVISSLEASAPGYSWADTIDAYGFEVIYSLTSGSPIPAGQLQNLYSVDFNFALPHPSSVLGVQVDFSSGLAYGSGPVTLTIQLTSGGTPIGTAKTQIISNWTTNYQIGGSTDLWGLPSLDDTQVNDIASPPTPGLGVIISAVLPDGTQINLNSIQATIWYYY